VFMFERSFAIVFRAVESASSPVSGIKKLAMVHLLLLLRTSSARSAAHVVYAILKIHAVQIILA
jgi:hypothetical protein